MLPTVIARVNVLGKNEPSILTFTDWHGREIGDHAQDYEPSGNDDDSVVNLVSDVIPGADPTRGCIDKNIRKNISPKLNFEVWKL